MATIVTRAGKGSPLTNTEVDANFTNLNTDKLENITGESIKDLSDVNSSMSPTNGQVLTWDNANTRWSSQDASGGIVDIVDDTTPQLGGDLDTNGNDITFGDNVKATFGAGNDLQIYHNAGYTYIDASNTPDYLFMTTGQSGFYLMDPSFNILIEQIGSGISLDYSSTSKLVTESTGVSVSGDIRATGSLFSNISINAQTGTTYTTVLTDRSKLVTLDNASAVTVTIPPNSSVAYPTGTKIDLLAKGAGQVTVAAGAGVTVNSSQTLNLRAQWSAASVVKLATDTWVLLGDLES